MTLKRSSKGRTCLSTKQIKISIIISSIVLTILLLNEYASLIKRSSTIAINHNNDANRVKYFSKTYNIDKTDIQKVTTADDYEWCQKILEYYDKNPQNGSKLLYEAWFTKREKDGHPIWNHRRVQHTFTSQHHQDWFLYTTMLKNMVGKGFYIDLAANNYRIISNTFFYDKCLSWNGICIEAQPHYLPNLIKHRNCQLIGSCVWNETKEMIFESNPEYFPWGSGIKGHNTIAKYAADHLDATIELKLICRTIQDICDEFNVDHVDYLSLDIEGAEMFALKGIDFNKLKIDIITVERNEKGESITDFLKGNGYIPSIMLFEDIVFIHKNAKDKIKWFNDWIKTAPWKGAINGVALIATHIAETNL